MRVTIHGRVQGVFFRQSTSDVASRLDIKGFVRNTIQGTVEAVFEGQNDDVNEIINWCRNGPAFARVQKIDITDETEKGPSYDAFTIERTV